MPKRAAVAFLQLLADCIKQSGPMGIPSGHLYAMVMDKISLEVYTLAIEKLKELGVIEEHYYLLTYKEEK